MHPVALHSHSIHVWHASYQVLAPFYPKWRAALSDAELAHATRLSSAEQASAYVSGRGFLKYLLAYYSGCSPKAIMLAYLRHGKPVIDMSRNRHDLRFNVSHTDEMIVCAVGTQYDLGIDVESMQKDVDTAHLARLILTATERDLYRQRNEALDVRRLMQAWVLKEAAVKASGRGLNFPLPEILSGPRADAWMALDSPASSGDIKRWWAKLVPIHETYACALVCEIMRPGFKVYDWASISTDAYFSAIDNGRAENGIFCRHADSGFPDFS